MTFIQCSSVLFSRFSSVLILMNHLSAKLTMSLLILCLSMSGQVWRYHLFCLISFKLDGSPIKLFIGPTGKRPELLVLLKSGILYL